MIDGGAIGLRGWLRRWIRGEVIVGDGWTEPGSRGHRDVISVQAARVVPRSVVCGLCVMLCAARGASADPRAKAAPALVALAPPATDDARLAIAIGPAGEVYEPDGKGAWVRHAQLTTGNAVAGVGRTGGGAGGGAVIAFGEGVVYRLAANGWSAIRLHQKEKAIASRGVNVVAAVGRQLFALDRTTNGEPTKLAMAPSNVIALATGPGTPAKPDAVVVQTERGLFRLDGPRLVAIKNAPQRIARLVSDRWVLVDGGAIDLRTGRKTGWPPGVTVVAAAVAGDGRLVLVTGQRGTLELATLAADTLDRKPIELPTPGGAPAAADVVGVAVDKAGRAVVALRDGRLLVRDRGTWATTQVTEDLPAPKPGSPPAASR